MNGVVLRAAEDGDAAALVPLLADLGYPGGEHFVDRRVRQLVGHPDALLLVAEGPVGVLGFISAHFVPQVALAGDICRISYLCVAEGARGSGIGARLEAAVVEAAARRGCDRIELHSHSRRVDAHRFYARLGFGESPKYLVKPVG